MTDTETTEAEDLTIPVVRSDTDREEDAELVFSDYGTMGAELAVKWGDGARQQKRFYLTTGDLEDLREWLGKALAGH